MKYYHITAGKTPITMAIATALVFAMAAPAHAAKPRIVTECGSTAHLPPGVYGLPYCNTPGYGDYYPAKPQKKNKRKKRR